jgi:HSP20 family protein
MSSLTRWQPFKEVQALRQQMDRLFDDLLHSQPIASMLPKEEWLPAIEIQETGANLIVKVEVPGMQPEDLDIHLSADRLEIAGEHAEEATGETTGTYHSELHYGKFHRVVTLPVKIEHEAAKATFENGVLRLTMPKQEPNQRSVVKIDLAGQLRETAAQQRQATAHRAEVVHERAVERLETAPVGKVTETVREVAAQQRQAEQQIQDSVHRRAADELHVGV